jgi:hypothetical protein
MKEKDTQDTLPTNVGRYPPISDLRVKREARAAAGAGQEHRDDTYGSKGTCRAIGDPSGTVLRTTCLLSI